MLCKRINLLYLLLCLKLELEDQRGHKVLTVMPIEFDLLLLVSLQCLGNINFWEEFFLLKPKMGALESEIGALQVLIGIVLAPF